MGIFSPSIIFCLNLLKCKTVITIYVNDNWWYYIYRKNIIKGRYKGMLQENLKELRKKFKLSQEQVAEKINVSRQTIAKWENGESIPDINSCLALSELYNVTLDNLVTYSKKADIMDIPPKGKYVFGIVKVDENWGITIPEKAREIFEIKIGDDLLILGDESKGGMAVMGEKFIKFVSECSQVND